MATTRTNARTTENKVLFNREDTKASNQQRPVASRVERETKAGPCVGEGNLIDEVKTPSTRENPSYSERFHDRPADDYSVDNPKGIDHTQSRQQQKWETRPIVTYVKKDVRHVDGELDLLDVIDNEIEQENRHMESGPNDVVLLGCTLWKSTEDSSKQFLRLTLKNVQTGVIDEVALFPGKKYTDYQGIVHSVGHNWHSFADEIKSQRNKAGKKTEPGVNLTKILKTYCTEGFRTWLIWDGKYLNMYATERKYSFAMKQLAEAREKGNPAKEVKKEKDDKPPFDVDEK